MKSSIPETGINTTRLSLAKGISPDRMSSRRVLSETPKASAASRGRSVSRELLDCLALRPSDGVGVVMASSHSAESKPALRVQLEQLQD
jgi:hypothetical protein